MDWILNMNSTIRSQLFEYWIVWIIRSNSGKYLFAISGGRHFEENATEPTPINEVVEFNTEEGQWVVNGALNFVRNYHAIDVIPFEDVHPYCIFDWKNVIAIL